MPLETLKARYLLDVRPLVEPGRLLFLNASVRSRGLCSERVLWRHLATSLPADGRLPVLPDVDGEPGVDGELGSLHLELLDVPEVLLLVLVGGLQIERPAHDLREHPLEHGVERFPDLNLDLVDGLRGDIALFLTCLGASELPRSLHPKRGGRYPKRVADDLRVPFRIGQRPGDEGVGHGTDDLHPDLPSGRDGLLWRQDDVLVAEGVVLPLALDERELPPQGILGQPEPREDVLRGFGLVE